MEIWKDVVGFEDLYEVSNIGNVRRKGKSLMLNHNVGTYYYCVLTRNCKSTKIGLHRILAQAFIPNPDNKPVIDHIDRNCKNNNLNNLRWVTYSENFMNRTKTKKNTSGYKGVYWIESKKKYRAEIKMNKIHYHLGYFESKQEAAKAYNEKAKELCSEYACLNVLHHEDPLPTALHDIQ